MMDKDKVTREILKQFPFDHFSVLRKSCLGNEVEMIETSIVKNWILDCHTKAQAEVLGRAIDLAKEKTKYVGQHPVPSALHKFATKAITKTRSKTAMEIVESLRKLKAEIEKGGEHENS